MRPTFSAITRILMLTGLTGLLAGGVLPIAQAASGGPSGYQVGETTAAPPPQTVAPGADPNADAGPVRLARIAYVTGDVTWRPDDTVDWSNATVNLPLREGAQLWVTEGRAEIQFDDGSYLRLGNGAVVTLQTLYSDNNGEFTEIRVTQGLTALRLMHAQSTYQVDTPTLSIKAAGPARVRVGVDDGAEVAVREGKAVIEDAAGDQSLYRGDYVNVTDPNAAFDVALLPPPDSWDQFNDERDAVLDHPNEHVPTQIGLVCSGLDDYGSWHTDDRYGDVWCPNDTPVDWSPYHYGHWIWCDPYGWTWVSDEPWGWAPYHYGSWIREPYGWCWAPGPRIQYWCPAVVHFTYYQDRVCWAPLCPDECRYPSRLSIAFRGGDWSLFFSIGGCAVYQPGGRNFCDPHPWRNDDCNRFAGNFSHHDFDRDDRAGRDRHDDDRFHFVPGNARFANCVTGTQADGFGRGGRFQTISSGADVFVHGRSAGSRFGADGEPMAGPGDVHPTLVALTPTHGFRQGNTVPPNVVDRPVFRSDVPTEIAQHGARGGEFFGRGTQTNAQGWALRNGAGQPIQGTSYHPDNAGGGSRIWRPSANNGPTQPGNPAGQACGSQIGAPAPGQGRHYGNPGNFGNMNGAGHPVPAPNTSNNGNVGADRNTGGFGWARGPQGQGQQPNNDQGAAANNNSSPAGGGFSPGGQGTPRRNEWRPAPGQTLPTGMYPSNQNPGAATGNRTPWQQPGGGQTNNGWSRGNQGGNGNPGNVDAPNSARWNLPPPTPTDNGWGRGGQGQPGGGGGGQRSSWRQPNAVSSPAGGGGNGNSSSNHAGASNQHSNNGSSDHSSNKRSDSSSSNNSGNSGGGNGGRTDNGGGSGGRGR